MRLQLTFLPEIKIVGFITSVCLVALSTKLPFFLFPELGALTYAVLRQPAGGWARSRFELCYLPFLTACIGMALEQLFGYSSVAVLVSIASSICVLQLRHSVVSPAIAAGLLPIVFEVTSWLFPICLGLSLVLLRLLTTDRRQPTVCRPAKIQCDYFANCHWIPYYTAFICGMLLLVHGTGYKCFLFPPLAVISLEMLLRGKACPWAGKKLTLVGLGVAAASVGLLLVQLFGVMPLAVGCACLVGCVLLRWARLFAPPVIAISLIPFYVAEPSWMYPIAVGSSLLLLAAVATAAEAHHGTRLATTSD